jgi:Protein of unknown function (DUF3311)
MRHRRPSAGTLVLAIVPFVAMCFTVPLWDRIDPMLLGLPFNLFWLIAWIVLTSLCLAIAYRLERARERSDESRP